ncbi:tRNA-specific adenosine deaminase [Pseudolycoriella hygida]|uniref:tRNA-specific adenosine deaminase n=1 Tax=Pseudolycoriella hygida TaxID=35572 RepID=A0A9Q0N6U1_9DIPT|nr:tRNA-specific adenosine deaminase [Pseudolycoriella hygida]
MDGDMTLYNSHYISDQICAALLAEFPGGEIIIHLDPYEALQQAQIAFDKNEVPVGAILVDRVTRKIVVKAHNMVQQAQNPLFHAEIVAINQISKLSSNKNLSRYDMYVTLEPCFMCAAAIAFSRIGRLFYAANDPKQGGIENEKGFFNNKACFHHPEIYSVGVKLAARIFHLEPIFEVNFQPGSYGCRPKRTAAAAIETVTVSAIKEKTRVIDIDLRSYFDAIVHAQLFEKIAERV